MPSPRLRLYDRLSGTVQEFEPNDGAVKLYVCGLTPYDATHLGHAFTFVSFDVLIRYLRYLGHEVRYVQNVTDVDDPLFAKAAQLGISHWDLAAAEIEQYEADMRGLNVLAPNVFPRASDEIGGMIELVQHLWAGGHAYAVDGYVYFDVATAHDYGKLSRYSRTEMVSLARQRGGDPDDPRRRDPLDFVLWRPAKEGEPTYASPWGPGLPGWHLECSTMALKYLGAPLDIHGGGSDLIFPHHENEIAQSEAVMDGHAFARFWMHNGMVYLGGEKMSKSLGNMEFVRVLLPRYGADALRLYLSGTHYRADLHYNAQSLAHAAHQAEEMAEAATTRGDLAQEPVDTNSYRRRFEGRMNDDLDTPGALAVLQELTDEIHTARATASGADSGATLLRELGGVLGLRLDLSSLPTHIAVTSETQTT